MEKISPRSFWIAVGVIALFLLGIWEPEAGRGIVRTLVRLVFFALAGMFGYWALMAIWRTLTASSADVKLSGRAGLILLGLFALTLAVFVGSAGALGPQEAIYFWADLILRPHEV